MRKLLVYADFDWLKEPKLVGELSYESLRGTDSYGFRFDEEWLRTQGSLFLSADLNHYSGVQYATGGDIFGCFSDALPDRWGRILLNRREQILAREEKRSLRRLTSFDYLLGIDDYSRMGGFRFKESIDDDFINSSPALRIPPLTDIRALVAASKEIEQSEERNELPDKRWIAQLLHPGTSLGEHDLKLVYRILMAHCVWRNFHLVKMIMMPSCGNISVIYLQRELGLLLLKLGCYKPQNLITR